MKNIFALLSIVFSLIPMSSVLAVSYTRDFPSTQEKTVSVFTDQIPAQSMSDVQIRFTAEHYVGTQKLYKNQIQKIRAYNPDFLMLHYRLAQAAGPAEGIAHSSEANMNGNEFSSEEWNKNLQNKDWFIKNTNGEKIRNTDWNWYPFDLSKSTNLRNEMADYWVDRVKQEVAATDSDGVFADSFGLVFGPWNVSGIPNFAFDSSWNIDITAAKSWLASALVPYSQRIWASLKAEGIYYIPNCAQLITSWDTVENYTYSDGCMIEGFVGFHESIDNVNDWKLEMNNILALGQKGKITIAQTSVQKTDLNRRSFVLGSYLMSKGEKSYLNMVDSGGLEWFPEYDLDLGAYTTFPSTVDSLQNGNIFRRNFAKGFVLVNPTAQSQGVNLDGVYKQAVFTGGGDVSQNGVVSGVLTYKNIQSLTLAPYSAAFLLNSETTSVSPDTSSCALTRDRAYKSPASSAVYYVDFDCKKRAFKNANIFFTYFDSWSNVKITTQTLLNRVPNHELGFMPLGPRYDPKYGALVKIVTDPKVYFLLNGKKYWIRSEVVFNALNYHWNWVEDIDSRLLDKYPSGGEIIDITHHLDGTIVKYAGNPEIYVIENNKKRHIPNEANFNERGYRWDRIVEIDDTEVYEDAETFADLPIIRIIAK
jgi:hypothetical protein